MDLIAETVLTDIATTGISKLLHARVTDVHLRQQVAHLFPTFEEVEASLAEIDYQSLKSYYCNQFPADVRDCLFLSGDAHQSSLREIKRKAYRAAGLKNDTGCDLIDSLIDQAVDAERDVYNALLPDAEKTQFAAILREIEKQQDFHKRKEKYLQRILTLLSAHDNQFTKIIDGIENGKIYFDNKFHYLNARINFYGRECQLNRLSEFLENNDVFRILCLCGPGGVGKSKLAYEFAKKHQKSSTWKIVFLNHTKLKLIANLENYSYYKNVMFIIDYANSNCTQIGELIYNLSETKTSTHQKIRFVLIDRLGLQTESYQTKLDFPYWYNQLLGSSRHRIGDENFDWVELSALTEDDLKSIMDDFARNAGHTLTKAAKNEIYQFVSNDRLQHKYRSLPLYTLIVTNAYLEGKPLQQWSINEVLDYTVDRNKKLWLNGDFQNNDELCTSFETLLYYATATGCMNLSDDTLPFATEKKRLRQHFHGKKHLSSQIERQKDRLLLHPFEPDIIGEYFVLQNLNEYYPADRDPVLALYWTNPVGFIEFLVRAFETYAQVSPFQQLFQESITLFVPPPECLKNPDVNTVTLFNNMVLYMDFKTVKAAIEQLEINYNGDPSFLDTIEAIATQARLTSHFDISFFICKKLLQYNTLSEEAQVRYQLGLASTHGFQEHYTEAIKLLTTIKEEHSDFLNANLRVKTTIECDICYAESLSNQHSDALHAEESFLPLIEQYAAQTDCKDIYLADYWYNYAVYLCRKQKIDPVELERVFKQLDRYPQTERKKAKISNQRAIYHEAAARLYKTEMCYGAQDDYLKESYNAYQLHLKESYRAYQQALKESYKAYQQSLKERMRYGDNHETMFVARAKDNLGRFMALNGYIDDQTKDLLFDAQRIFKAKLAENNSILARNRYNIGMYYLEKPSPDYKLAKNYIQQAKTMFESLPNPDEQSGQHDWCQTRLEFIEKHLSIAKMSAPL